MVSVNMREMLEAGVHFGHQVRKWNPKMKPYIYGKKNGIYIINLQTSIELFKEALSFVTDVVSSGKEALIVGTKKQAQSIITDVSEETGMHYVNKRWLGGLLTNFPMVRKSIEKLIDQCLGAFSAVGFHFGNVAMQKIVRHLFRYLCVVYGSVANVSPYTRRRVRSAA